MGHIYDTALATSVNKLFVRAKRILTHNNNDVLVNTDFSEFNVADLNGIVFLSVICDFFRHLHSYNVSSSNFKLLVNVNKSTLPRTSNSFKFHSKPVKKFR